MVIHIKYLNGDFNESFVRVKDIVLYYMCVCLQKDDVKGAILVHLKFLIEECNLPSRWTR